MPCASPLGSKFEHNDYSGFEAQPSGRIAWVPDDRQLLWTSIARAVRTPSRIEHDLEVDFVTPPSGFGRLIGDDRFRSEKVLSYQAGYRVQPLETLFLDVTGFYNRYDDLLTIEPGAPFEEAADGGTRTIQPLFFAQPPARRDLRLRARRPTPPSRAGGAFTASTRFFRSTCIRDPGSRDTSSEQAEDTSPHHQVTARSTMSLPESADFDAVLRYVDDIAVADVSGYVTLDLRLAKRFGTGFELSVVGLNLLQDHHREFNGGTEVERSIYGQFRWWW